MPKQTRLSPEVRLDYDAMRLSIGNSFFDSDADRAATQARVEAAGYVKLANGNWRKPRSTESSPRCPTVSGEIETP